MSHFPGSIMPVPSFGTTMADVMTHTQFRDQMVDEMRATQLELGTHPSGNFSTVKARFDAQTVFASHVPAGSVDGNTAGLTNWVTFSSPIAVPSGTTLAVVQMNIAEVECVTAVHEFFMAVKIGTVESAARAHHAWGAVGNHVPISFAAAIAAPPVGSQNLIVMHNRVGASGATRATVNTRFSAVIHFL